MREITVGMAQILVETGKTRSNLERAKKNIKAAHEKNCDIVVLPECLDIGWTNPAAFDLAEEIPGPNSLFLCEAAKEFSIYVVAGLTEKYGNDIYNSAILISPEGKILLKHRKINILDIAQDIYSIGDSLSVVNTGLGKIGIDICADNFPTSQVIGHCLARMGAQIILSPSSWAVPPDHNEEANPCALSWEKSYKELSRLYDIPVIGVSNVGPVEDGVWKDYKCIGKSTAVADSGKKVYKCPYGVNEEKLLVIKVEIKDPVATGTTIAEELVRRGYDKKI